MWSVRVFAARPPSLAPGEIGLTSKTSASPSDTPEGPSTYAVGTRPVAIRLRPSQRRLTSSGSDLGNTLNRINAGLRRNAGNTGKAPNALAVLLRKEGTFALRVKAANAAIYALVSKLRAARRAGK